MRILNFLYGGISTANGVAQTCLFDHPDRYGNQLTPYRGKPLLIVNTATRCGFARQYDSLEALYEKYSARGLVVVGFPSNDFAGQEPGSDADIESVCRINHGVTFPLMPKASVSGVAKQPLFTFLVEEGAPDLGGRVWWNFEKFLISREGYLIGRWRSYVSPTARSLVRAIESAL